MEDMDEDEDVEWRTLPQPTVLSHAVPVSQGEELGHTVRVASDWRHRRHGQDGLATCAP